MKNTIFIVLLLMLCVVGCGKPMSTKDYQGIRYELETTSCMPGRERYLLEEVCKKYGYNANDFINKEKSLKKEGYFYH